MSSIKAEVNAPHYDHAQKVAYMMVKKLGRKVPSRKNKPYPTDGSVAENVTMSLI